MPAGACTLPMLPPAACLPIRNVRVPPNELEAGPSLLRVALVYCLNYSWDFTPSGCRLLTVRYRERKEQDQRDLPCAESVLSFLEYTLPCYPVSGNPRLLGFSLRTGRMAWSSSDSCSSRVWYIKLRRI